jgi:CRP-like cAMP-binding protein
MDLYSYFNLFHPVSEEVFSHLQPHMHTRSYARGEIITREGQVQRDLLFVKAGYQISYLNHNGKVHVMAFTYPPNLCTIPDSFLLQRPSQYVLQCISDSEFDAISHSALMQLFDEQPVLERLFRKFTEAVLVGLIQRHIDLHTLSIEERFRGFAARSPHLLHAVPHKYIASYLDIDPTNFSKLFNSIRI